MKRTGLNVFDDILNGKRLVIALKKKTPCKVIVLLLLISSFSACANVDVKKSGSSPVSFLRNIFNKETPAVTGVRMRPADEASRVEIAASAPFKYVSYRFHNPERLVIEMRNVDNSIIGDILLKEDAIVKKIEMVNFEKSGKGKSGDLPQRAVRLRS